MIREPIHGRLTVPRVAVGPVRLLVRVALVDLDGPIVQVDQLGDEHRFDAR
jgi:hypothetical protein